MRFRYSENLVNNFTSATSQGVVFMAFHLWFCCFHRFWHVDSNPPGEVASFGSANSREDITNFGQFGQSGVALVFFVAYPTLWVFNFFVMDSQNTFKSSDGTQAFYSCYNFELCFISYRFTILLRARSAYVAWLIIKYYVCSGFLCYLVFFIIHWCKALLVQ